MRAGLGDQDFGRYVLGRHVLGRRALDRWCHDQAHGASLISIMLDVNRIVATGCGGGCAPGSEALGIPMIAKTFESAWTENSSRSCKAPRRRPAAWAGQRTTAHSRTTGTTNIAIGAGRVRVTAPM